MKFTTVKATLDSLIKYKNCFYAVPSFYKSKELELRIYKGKIQIYYNTELIEIYEIQNKKLNYKEYIHMEHSLENMVSPSDEAIEQALANFKSLEEV
ncbi:MAG: Mu transposase domain-containing protein, partial [Culicoidibacterales bacterium]